MWVHLFATISCVRLFLVLFFLPFKSFPLCGILCHSWWLEWSAEFVCCVLFKHAPCLHFDSHRHWHWRSRKTHGSHKRAVTWVFFCFWSHLDSNLDFLNQKSCFCPSSETWAAVRGSIGWLLFSSRLIYSSSFVFSFTTSPPADL